MKLSDMINNLKYKIPPEEYVLVEYELFFNDDLGKYNRFSIDDEEEIKKLKNLLSTLNTDKDTVLYVCAYSDEDIDYKGDKFMYADCIWLKANDLSVNYINQLFDSSKSIQPSAVLDLNEMDEYNQEHFYLFTNDGVVVDLRKISPKESFNNVIILYWD